MANQVMNNIPEDRLYQYNLCGRSMALKFDNDAIKFKICTKEFGSFCIQVYAIVMYENDFDFHQTIYNHIEDDLMIAHYQTTTHDNNELEKVVQEYKLE